MDKVRKYTDKQLKKLEQRLAREYSSAKKELEKKWKEYMAQVKKQLQPYEAAYDSAVKGGVKTEIADAKAALDNMKRSLTLSSPRYDEMVDNLTDRMAHVNETALAYINDKVPDLYIANHNAIAPTAQSLGIDFTLINKNTLKNVTMSRSLPLPKKLNIAKDKRWNAKKMNSSLLQGILQGESMDKIAARMLPIVGGNQAAAIRSARTMVTQAENKGRLDSYHELEDMGTIMKKRWIATADEVTRESHLEMDGEEVDLDETFSNGLMYPGDPDGDPGEVYNCRCTMETVILGFMDADGNINYIDESLHEDAGHHEQIEEEIERREDGREYDSRERKIAQGKDLSDTWERRPDKFDFEIDDVIDSQGFNGKPQIVSDEEFDKAVQEANNGKGFIAQRTYSAPDQETLDFYRNQLYNGKWYVDCSNGGCAYGKGMYSVYSNGTTVTEYMEREMRGYGMRRGIEYNYIETFTLTKDARTVTPNELSELRQAIYKEINDGLNERGGWFNKEAVEWAAKRGEILNLDDGSFAALLGYDAILTEGIDDYAIILNRTKVIFKGGRP